eukprot:2070201-Heterocapsa_arctica.AAC.1
MGQDKCPPALEQSPSYGWEDRMRRVHLKGNAQSATIARGMTATVMAGKPLTPPTFGEQLQYTRIT